MAPIDGGAADAAGERPPRACTLPRAATATRTIGDDRRCQSGVCLVFARTEAGGFGSIGRIAENDFWLGGAGGAIYRLTGDTLQDYSGFCTAPADETTVVTAFLTGEAETIALVPAFALGFLGVVFGNYGYLFAWDGSTWRLREVPNYPLVSGWRSPSGTLWIGSWYGRLYQGSPMSFVSVDNPIRDTELIRGIWGTSDTHLYVVSSYMGIAEMDGMTWTTISRSASDPDDSTPRFSSVQGTGSGTVWAVADTGLVRISGGTWTMVQRGAFNAISVVADDDIWLAGPGGALSHWNGSTLSTITWTWDLKDHAPTLVAVWASAEQVLAVGSDWAVLRLAR